MSEAISIRMDPACERLLAAAKNFPVAQLARVIDVQNKWAVDYIQKNKLSFRGPMTLGVISTRLRNSIWNSKARWTGMEIESSIGSNVAYAGIHEHGGTTRPHIIEAKPGKALAFAVSGSGGFRFFSRKSLKALGKAGASQALAAMTFRQRVHHPGSKIPARHYIENSIRERMPAYSEALSKAVLGILGGPQVT